MGPKLLRLSTILMPSDGGISAPDSRCHVDSLEAEGLGFRGLGSIWGNGKQDGNYYSRMGL